MKIKGKKALEKETMAKQSPKFLEKSYKKVSQKVGSLATRNHNSFMPVKIFKSPSILVSSDIPTSTKKHSANMLILSHHQKIVTIFEKCHLQYLLPPRMEKKIKQKQSPNVPTRD